jgi:hypothetical protein
MTERLAGPSVLHLVSDMSGPTLLHPFHDPLERRPSDANLCNDLIVSLAFRAHGHHTGLSVRADSPRSPLGRHVGHVDGVAAEKQVGRVAARRIVAAVADIHALRDRTAGQAVGDAVRVRPSFAIPYPAVALGVPLGSQPRPATVRVALVNPRPEPAGEVRQSAAEVPAAPRAVPLRRIGGAAHVGRAEKADSAPLTGQCDTLRGHRVTPSLGVVPPGVASIAGALCMGILP